MLLIFSISKRASWRMLRNFELRSDREDRPLEPRITWSKRCMVGNVITTFQFAGEILTKTVPIAMKVINSAGNRVTPSSS